MASILYCEDDGSVREATLRIWKIGFPKEHVIVSAKSLDDALLMYKKADDKPKVLITDGNLGRCADGLVRYGWDLVEMLKRRHFDGKAIYYGSPYTEVPESKKHLFDNRFYKEEDNAAFVIKKALEYCGFKANEG